MRTNIMCILVALVDDRLIRVYATENHRLFNTRSSANNLI